MKFTKVTAGHYATEDGRYAVVVDGHAPIKSNGADAQYEGFIGGEWAAVFSDRGGLREDHNVGENIEWSTTKREAIEWAERHARNNA